MALRASCEGLLKAVIGKLGKSLQRIASSGKRKTRKIGVAKGGGVCLPLCYLHHLIWQSCVSHC